MNPDNLSYITYLWHKALAYFEAKAFVAGVIAIATFLFDPLQKEAMLALLLLIILDFVFGVSAAKKTGEEIKSAKILRSALKLTIYFSLIAASRVSEFALPYFGFLDETVTGFLVATELVSILENVGRLGYAIPKQLLNKLNDYTHKN